MNKLSDFRRKKSSKFANIKNPKDARKRLIQIDTLPNELQARVKELLGLSDKLITEVMELTKLTDASKTVPTAVKIVDGKINLTLPYIAEKLEALQPILADIQEFEQAGSDYDTAARWSRMRQVLRFYHEEVIKLENKEQQEVLRLLIVRSQEPKTI